MIVIVVCILTRPTESPKYATTRKNTQRYYTTKRLIRYIYMEISSIETSGLTFCVRMPDLLVSVTKSIQLAKKKEKKKKTVPMGVPWGRKTVKDWRKCHRDRLKFRKQLRLAHLIYAHFLSTCLRLVSFHYAVMCE